MQNHPADQEPRRVLGSFFAPKSQNTPTWEQRKLGDLCVEFRSGEFISASDITETGEYPVFGGNGLRGFTDRFNHDGEYTLIGRQGALCGNVNFAVGKSYFTEHAIAVRADKKNQTRFLYYLFSTMDLGQYSGQSAQPGLAVGNLVELKSTLPDKQEQEKISGVLTALDTLITLHQRKYEKLVNIKKSMLDKMFPKNGASVPEIRFKGFTDPWEQRKLGDISEIKTWPFGSTLHADDYVSDGIPIITTEHFKTGLLPIDKCGLPQVSENDFSRLSAYILNAGDIVFSRVGSVDINALITPFQSTWLFSGRVLRVRPQNKNSSQFLHTLLETEDVKNDIRTRAVGQTMPSINTEILKTTPLRLPESTLEQEQLGKYFLNLDTLITLHQRKLEKLQNIKKSCLEKMFV